MSRPFSLLAFLLLFLVLASCIYSNNEVYVAEPQQSNPAVIDFRSNLDSISPLLIGDSLLFSYETTITGGELYFVDAFLEDQWLYDRDVEYDPDTLTGPFTLADSFWIQAAGLPDQEQLELSVFLYHSSNSNTLADLLGLEYNVSEHYYNLTQEGE